MIRSAPATEGDPTVQSTLPVDDEVTHVRESLAISQSDSVQDLWGDRLGGNHQGIKGH